LVWLIDWFFLQESLKLWRCQAMAIREGHLKQTTYDFWNFWLPLKLGNFGTNTVPSGVSDGAVGTILTSKKTAK